MERKAKRFFPFLLSLLLILTLLPTNLVSRAAGRVKMNGVYYDSLQEALNAINEDETEYNIDLLGNTEAINTRKAITYPDGHTYKYQYEPSVSIKNGTIELNEPIQIGSRAYLMLLENLTIIANCDRAIQITGYNAHLSCGYARYTPPTNYDPVTYKGHSIVIKEGTISSYDINSSNLIRIFDRGRFSSSGDTRFETKTLDKVFDVTNGDIDLAYARIDGVKKGVNFETKNDSTYFNHTATFTGSYINAPDALVVTSGHSFGASITLNDTDINGSDNIISHTGSYNATFTIDGGTYKSGFFTVTDNATVNVKKGVFYTDMSEVPVTSTGTYFCTYKSGNTEISVADNASLLSSLSYPIDTTITLKAGTMTLPTISDDELCWGNSQGKRVTGEVVYSASANNVYTVIEKPCEHLHTTVINQVDATCTEDGYTGDTKCLDCGEIIEEGTVVPSPGHKWSEWETVREASCVAQGTKKRICSVCEEEDSDTIPIDSTKHNLENQPAVLANCIRDGKLESWYCKDCHKLFLDEDATQETSAEDIVVPMTSTHNLTHHDAVAKTCTAAGNIEYWTCGDCLKIFSDENGTTEITSAETVTPASHNIVAVSKKEADCYEAGNVAHWKCLDCNKVFLDSAGKTEVDAEDVLIAKKPHILTLTEAVAPTCTEDGNIAYYTCSGCGSCFADNEGKNEITPNDILVKATGHSTKATAAKEATCTEAGNTAYWTCENCGKLFSDEDCTVETTAEAVVLPVLPHTLTKVSSKEATCIEDGNLVHWKCSVCNKLFSDEEGKNEVTLEEITLKKGHKLVETKGVPATCENAGTKTYYTCSVCNKRFLDNEGKTEVKTDNDLIAPALGHDWGEWTVIKEPSYEEEGLARRICKTDSTHTEEKTIDKLTSLPVTEIKPGAKNVSVNIGVSKTLSVTVLPANATDKTLSYKSSNKKIATVDNNGKVTGVASGTTTITITAEDTKKVTATVKITVNKPTVKYTTYVQKTGWTDTVADGAFSGTKGLGYRLEGIKINLGNIAGTIQYRTYIQKQGWEKSWAKNGGFSGTKGLGYRLEATQIKLTGTAKTYFDVYYRCYAQKFGWLGWAKNGAAAGTAGYGYRLEGIQIKLVSKGSSAPGSTANAYRKNQ